MGDGRQPDSNSKSGYMHRQTNTMNYSREAPLAQALNIKIRGNS